MEAYYSYREKALTKNIEKETDNTIHFRFAQYFLQDQSQRGRLQPQYQPARFMIAKGKF